MTRILITILFVLAPFSLANADTELARLLYEDVTVKIVEKSEVSIEIELTNTPRGVAKISEDGASATIKLKRKNPAWWGNVGFREGLFAKTAIISSEENAAKILITTNSTAKIKTSLYRKKSSLFVTISGEREKLVSTPTPEISPTVTPTALPTIAATKEAEATPTIIPTITATNEAETTPTIIPTITETATISPTVSESETPTPTATTTITPTTLPTTTPTVEPTAMSGLQLSAINFIRPNSIELTFSEPAAFELITIDSTNYLFRVTGSQQLAEHLKLPYFPPSDFNWLNSIMPANTSSGIEITLNVSKDIKLQAVPAKDKVIIKPAG